MTNIGSTIPASSQMILTNLQEYNIVLASKSPRRQQLLKGLEIDFEIRTKDVDESFPHHLRGQEIPLYLSKIKADAFVNDMQPQDLIITADTVVWINHHVLNKPDNKDEALKMLSELNGNTHMVYTAVTLTSQSKQISFFDETLVEFAELTPEELKYYIERYLPLDKAGAYGVQELIGYIGIKKLVGSYFNVMGLPVHMLYEQLKNF